MSRKKAHLHDVRDNVAVALEDLGAGDTLVTTKGEVERTIEVREPVQFGHKVALEPIDVGGDVVKYGGFIGKATRSIEAGQHVHVHNIKGVKYT